MKFYLDSAIFAEAKEVARWGWVEGITTNPTLLAQSAEKPDETLRKLASEVRGQVFYQLTQKTTYEMMKEAEKAQELLGAKLVLKIPPTEAGFEITASLSGKIPCAVTAIYHPSQALAAQAAGAHIAMIYFHRALNLLDDGLTMAREVVEVLEGTYTAPMAASIKSPDEVVAAARLGYKHLTVPFAILKSLMTHPISEQSIVDFDAKGCGIDIK
jgi:transaldolase